MSWFHVCSSFFHMPCLHIEIYILSTSIHTSHVTHVTRLVPVWSCPSTWGYHRTSRSLRSGNKTNSTMNPHLLLCHAGQGFSFSGDDWDKQKHRCFEDLWSVITWILKYPWIQGKSISRETKAFQGTMFIWKTVLEGFLSALALAQMSQRLNATNDTGAEKNLVLCPCVVHTNANMPMQNHLLR